jgi:site-specific DNA-methyltransferase (adenine-specific)
MVRTPTGNTLFYGDNLAILREHVADESVDLVYLDPPFNSNAAYNVLFKAPDGHKSQAQIEAFDDTWHWNDSAEQAFDEVICSGNSDAAEMLRAMRSFLKENDMMAYLAMMAARTASHYLKVLLDAVFGPKLYINEIIWVRANAHNFKTRYWPRQHDVLLLYGKSESTTVNPQYEPYGPEQLSRYKVDENGRLYTGQDMTVSLVRRLRQFQWRGVTPPPHRSWGASLEQLEAWYKEGRILLRKDGKPRLDGLKVYLDETKGKQIGTVWDSLDRIKNTSGERLGYPTQKPLALLERIIAASSNEGDLVLDPFCGCGTTVHAAQKLNRRWVGIDVTHLAIHLIKRRLTEAFASIRFDIVGEPKDLDGARALALADKYEFQKWAPAMISAQPYKGGKKGGDGGVDGYLYIKPDGKKTEKVIVSVKGGQSLTPAMVKDLIVTVDQEGAKMGVFLTLEPPTKGMIAQAAAAGFYKPEGDQQWRTPFPKIQIVTVEDLFKPSNPLLLPWQDTSVFKKAVREKKENSQSELDL